jgi:hypothetical protein
MSFCGFEYTQLKRENTDWGFYMISYDTDHFLLTITVNVTQINDLGSWN